MNTIRNQLQIPGDIAEWTDDKVSFTAVLDYDEAYPDLSWCSDARKASYGDEWFYVYIAVHKHGDPDVVESLSGIESDSGRRHFEDVALELAGNCG